MLVMMAANIIIMIAIRPMIRKALPAADGLFSFGSGDATELDISLTFVAILYLP